MFFHKKYKAAFKFWCSESQADIRNPLRYLIRLKNALEYMKFVELNLHIQIIRYNKIRKN